MKAVSINKEPIKLSQFLKLADIIMNGAEARMLLEDGRLLVNGKVEARRGRKLYNGDSLEYGGECYKVILQGE